MMENKLDEAKIIDYLYGELPEEESKAVEKVLKDNPDLNAEMQSLQAARGMLGKLEDREMIAPTFVFNEGGQSISFLQSNAFRWVASIAAGLTLLLVSAAILNLNVSNSNQGLQIGFGELTPLPDEALSKNNVKAWMAEAMSDYEAVTDKKIEAVQTQLTAEMESQDQKNMTLMAGMMKKHSAGTGQLMQQYVAQLNDENKEIIQNFFTVSSQKQKTYVKTVMADFNEFYQNQRNYDLRLIETSLNKIQNNQDVKQLEQDQLLASLYDMVKTQSK